MKKRFLFIILSFFPLLTYSELKDFDKFVDTSQLKGFKTLMSSTLDITNNSKYIVYNEEISINDRNRKSSVIFKSLTGNWQKVIYNIEGRYELAANNKYAIFRRANDNLCILKLGSDDIEYFPDVKGFRVLLENEKTVIAYTSTKDRSLTILDVDSKKKSL